MPKPGAPQVDAVYGGPLSVPLLRPARGLERLVQILDVRQDGGVAGDQLSAGT